MIGADAGRTLNDSAEKRGAYAGKRGESCVFGVASVVAWQRQMIWLLAHGGLLNKQGHPINTPAQRLALVLAAYGEAHAAIEAHGTEPLLGRLDATAAESFDALASELTPAEINGLVVAMGLFRRATDAG